MNGIPPFLEHLPVYRGLPVPYVAMWSYEMQPSAARIQRWRGIDWIWTDDQRGEPDFGSTNSHRQRNGMRRSQCQVCGRIGARTWVVPDDETHIDLWDNGRWIINPPVHRECLQAAQHLCPHLVRRPAVAIFDAARRLPIVAYTVRTSTEGDLVLPIDATSSPYPGRQLVVSADGADLR